ncbi:MAG: c-type cytochrome [Planctomycetes bacterium]|nr:c-type cytochrome [Planctomycetota bacterium]
MVVAKRGGGPWGLALGMWGSLFFLTSCDSSPPAGSTPAPSGPPPVGQGAPPSMPGGPAMGAPPVAPIDENDPHAAGMKVYAINACGRCHRMNGGPGPGGMAAMAGMYPGASGGGGPPGGGGGRAPDLAKVGADPEHTVEWLSAVIRDPKSKKEDAHMPPFPAEKINDTDLQALAEYLASLKGDAPAAEKKESTN